MMNDNANKASICSIVFLDVVDFAKKTEAEKLEIRGQLNSLIDQAVIDIAQDERTVTETSNGAVIACNGPLEDALEDALFISLTMRDELLKNSTSNASPLYVRFGINLGQVRMANGKNNQPGMVGEGIEEAERIASFAEPNQILVSRPYFEVASKLSQEISQMFEYNDMHAHDQDVYTVRLLKEKAAAQETVTEEAPTIPRDIAQSGVEQMAVGKFNWNYLALGLMVIAVLFVLAKLVITPTEPTIILEEPLVSEVPAKPAPTLADKPDIDTLPSETVKESPAKVEPEKTKNTQKNIDKKSEKKAEKKPDTSTGTAAKPSAPSNGKPADKSTETQAEKKSEKDKSTWDSIKDSVKQGEERKCTQAEIALGQCR